MPRTEITKIAVPGSYAHLGTVSAFTAADTTNKNQFRMSGKDLVVVRNTAGGAATVTFTSTLDTFGRTKDISESIPAGQFRIYGPFNFPGWQTVSGFLELEGQTGIEFLVIEL